MTKKILLILLIIGIFLPGFAILSAQSVSPPETLEEAKEIGIKAKEEIKLNFAKFLENIWEEKIRPIWQKLWNFFKTIFKKITTPFIKEIERRKPIIKEEFKKEKQEIKEEIKTELPKTGKFFWEKFWEKFKGLIK